MNRSRAGKGFAAMPASSWYEIFLPSPDGNSLVVNDQRITALHNDHVFVEIVHMRLRACSFMTGPESHLTAVRAIEKISFRSRSSLTGCGDSISGTLHKTREVVHRFSSTVDWLLICQLAPDFLQRRPPGFFGNHR